MNPQVILLAAGKSSRTWPIKEKTLFRFLGKTVLEHQVETLVGAGLADICVVGNSENIDAFRLICEKISGADFSFAVQQDLDEGVRGGILAAATEIDPVRPVLIVCSNDMVEKSVYKSVLEKAKNTEADIYLAGKIVEDYFPGGYLSVNGDNSSQVVGIVEKPGAGNEPSNLVTILVHLYKSPQTLVAALKQVSSGDMYEETLHGLFDKGVLTEVVEYNGFWQPIKYPWHLLDLMAYFLQTLTPNIHPDAIVADTAVIRGSVVIERGVKVFDYAVINGPAYIGADTVVANHSLVREAIIEANCMVGHTTEIARSVLQANCWTHQNFVGDSIFDENVSLGAGARTANLRLDEHDISSEIKGEKMCSEKDKFGSIIGRNVRIGVNASTMPGVKVGQDSFLGAGGVYGADVPEKQFTYLNQEFVTAKNRSSAVIRDNLKN